MAEVVVDINHGHRIVIRFARLRTLHKFVGQPLPVRRMPLLVRWRSRLRSRARCDEGLDAFVILINVMEPLAVDFDRCRDVVPTRLSAAIPELTLWKPRSVGFDHPNGMHPVLPVHHREV